MSLVHAMRARFLATLLFCFAAIGLVLSVVGVSGVLAQTSRNRTREMGIRIALGARAGSGRWLVVRQGLRLTAVEERLRLDVGRGGAWGAGRNRRVDRSSP